MKNKKKLIVFGFTLICLLSSLMFVKAESIKCEYNDVDLMIDDAGNISVDSDFYTDYKLKEYLFSFNYNVGDIDVSSPDLEYQLGELKGYCPQSLYVCKYEEFSWNSGFAHYFLEDSGAINVLKKVLLFTNEEDAEKNTYLKGLENNKIKLSREVTDAVNAAKEACSISKLWTDGESYLGDGKIEWNDLANFIPGLVCGTGVEVYEILKGITYGNEIAYIKYKSCNWNKYDGDLPTYSLACPNLTVLLDRFNGALKEYSACSKTDAACKSQKLTIVKEKEEHVKKYCDTITENYNYDDGVQEQCLDACFDVGLNMIKSKKQYGLISDNNNECGFSARLLVWASNILRWIKYILPVAVIIFGILDFIKAIGADKDDEMKKAQKRFIIRLIAAALVFIIPLILEFVLDKMGFGYNDCGLF